MPEAKLKTPRRKRIPHAFSRARVSGRAPASDDVLQQDATTRRLVPVSLGAAGAGAVLEADFDAQTILAAILNNTPLPLTIAEQRVVGRQTGGDVAALTIGIGDNNVLEVDGSPNDDEYARFTAAGLEGRTYAEAKADLDLEIGTDVLAEQTVGIADDNLLEVDHAAAVDDDYAKFTANGLEGRSYAEVRGDINVADGADVTGDNAPQAHVLLDDAAHSDSVADSVTRGSLVVGNATPKWDELVAGSQPASNTTPSNVQTTWASKTGDARKYLCIDASGDVAWASIIAYDIKNPPAITSLSDGLGNTEIASTGTVTPNFTVAYEGTPSAASIDVQAYSSDDPEVNPGDYPITLSSPYTGYTGEPAINKETTAVGATVTWRVSATVDSVALTKDHTLTYLNRKYYGPSTETTTLTTTQVKALDADADGGSALDANYAGTWVVNAAANEYIWFAFRDQLQTDNGNPTFTVGGFPGGFADKGTVAHTNDSGFVETYRLWRSDNHSLGSTTVVVT